MKHVFNHAFKIYLSTLNCILVEYVIDQMHQELRMTLGVCWHDSPPAEALS